MGKVPGPEKLMDELLDLYKELVLPFMKIRRDMPFPTEGERDETDGEHAYTLSMIAITLAERMKLNLDTGLIAKYALVHDLVEVHAGDVSARADAGTLAKKAKREQESFLLIKDKYLDHAPWIVEYIEKYESRQDDESKFVYAADKLMGALVRIAGDGVNWASYYTDPDGKDYHRVVEVLRKKAKSYPPLIELFETFHARLDELRPGYFDQSKGKAFKQP
jgi:5'-deoxynucleotidase YfbR-like HD superfamily hydrolase